MDNSFEELNDFNRYVPNPFSFRVPSGDEFTPMQYSSSGGTPDNNDDQKIYPSSYYSRCPFKFIRCQQRRLPPLNLQEDDPNAQDYETFIIDLDDPQAPQF